MYDHAQVFDANPDEGEPRMVAVGNNALEVLARDPKRYFVSKEAFDAANAAEVERQEAAKRAEAEAKAKADAEERARLEAAKKQKGDEQ